MSQTNTCSFNTPEAVMQIMTQLNKIIDQYEELAQRRMLPRREIVMPILIQLLNENKLPCSETMEGVCLDISFGGIGFMCLNQHPHARYALIQFQQALGQHVPVIVDIKNQTMMGSFCKLGGVFDVDWASMAAEP